MAFLVDGNNFIGHTSPELLRSPEGRFNLLRKLCILHWKNRAKIFVVFDGPPDSVLEKAFQSASAVKILFPDPEENADQVIKTFLEKRKDKKHLVLVSADRELRDFARHRGFTTLTSREFNKELKNAIRDFKKHKEEQKIDERMSPLEVAQWLDIFKN